MQRIFYFLRKIVISPFIILAKSMGQEIRLFGYPPNSVPVLDEHLTTWSELLNQIRKAKSNKHTSPYPTYFLHFEEIGAKYDGYPINKGSFIDPLGNVYTYDHSGNWPKYPKNDEAGILMIEEILRKDLLINISNSKKEKTKYDNIEINLEKIVRSIMRYGYTYGGPFYPDSISSYSSILIYDEIKDVYKRIVFYGEVTSNSWYISNIYKRLILKD